MPNHQVKGQPAASTYGQERGVSKKTVIVKHPVVSYVIMYLGHPVGKKGGNKRGVPLSVSLPRDNGFGTPSSWGEWRREGVPLPPSLPLRWYVIMDLGHQHLAAVATALGWAEAFGRLSKKYNCPGVFYSQICYYEVLHQWTLGDYGYNHPWRSKLRESPET